MKYIKNYSAIKDLINDCDALIIGLGSGISASGGLDYMSEEVFKSLYLKYYKLGYKYIFHAISNFWVTNINSKNEKDYWDFWTRHIYNVRYNIDTLEPYTLLKQLVGDKKYFVITTNADGQTQRVFDNVYAPQGDYSLLQCRINCNNRVYDNKDFVYSNLDDTKIIPKCECGNHLTPNLRCDDYFCDTNAMLNYDKYYDFVMNNIDKKLVLLEIGVGFNTPVIIRYPFDKMSQKDNVALIRINSHDADVENGISIKEDILKVLREIIE